MNQQTLIDLPKACELCHREHVLNSPLCGPCGEAISRLMSIKQYAQGLARDRRANQQQAHLLLAALGAR